MPTQDPNSLPEAVCDANTDSKRGHLKIFFGYADGTNEILTAAANQIIMLLGRNIVIYCCENQRIGEPRVFCADNGFGISDEMKNKVFDMFFSGANSIADSRRSIGIGLSLCKSIVNAHGGDISVSDNTPHGAVFTFTLPAKEVNIHEQDDHFSC